MSPDDLGVPALPDLLAGAIPGVGPAWAPRGDAAPAARRLRVKPGTSAVLGLRLADGPVLVRAFSPGAAAKLDAAVRKTRPEHLRALDRARGVIVVDAAGDRDLPALRRLLAAAPAQGPRTLSYNPQRRWVGRGDDATVVRAVRAAAVPGLLAGLRLHAGADLAVPRLVRARPDRGLVEVGWVAGRALDARSDETALRTAGAAVAALHAARPTDVDDAAAPRAATAGVAPTLRLLRLLLPGEAARIDGLEQAVRRLVSALPREPAPPGGPVPLHGDLSRDQLLLADDGSVGVVDLDRARWGSPVDDLASLIADDLGRGARPGALLEGYAASRDLPCAAALRAHTLAALLRRSTEPFRACDPAWREQTRRRLETAAALADGATPW